MHIYFRHTDALGVVGVAPGTFFAMVDQNGYWGNVRAIDPAKMDSGDFFSMCHPISIRKHWTGMHASKERLPSR